MVTVAYRLIVICISKISAFLRLSLSGALYNDGTAGRLKNDDNVQPNQTFVYRWDVTAQYAGPKRGARENCIAWPYTSQRYNAKDQNAGLIGATIVCRRGK